MNTVRDHYDQHLARIYTWMAGGVDQALAMGTDDVAPFLDRPGHAVDLGAGFGMHSIPLARAGFEVLALDTSAQLLGELRARSAGLSVDVVECDLRQFRGCLRRPADLILCMGDTLAHLDSLLQVRRLMHDVARSLAPEGRFVATFRDYRQLRVGAPRFIPVRSDPERILTCVLEARRARVRVHDILHERAGDGWSMQVGSYAKLRLSPDHVIEAAQTAGMRCHAEPGPRGMLKVVAHATPRAGDHHRADCGATSNQRGPCSAAASVAREPEERP